MSRSWNGESLVNELSALLGDTSTAFKSRVLGWANDVIFDISTRHDWGHHLTKGKKFLVPESETHELEVEAASAPEVELEADGNLTIGSTYSFAITFVQDNGVETQTGEESSELVVTTDNRTISLDQIPTSDESLVTKRNIYIKKDDGEFYYHSTIEDNFTTYVEISEDTDSLIEPPEYESVRRIKGAPFFEESPSNYLTYKDIDQLRLLAQGQWALGDPEYFSPIEANSISTYPIPSREMELSFYYYRNPFKLYKAKDSQPDIPIYLKQALKAGVIAMGYEYRDRAGQEIKRANYENALVDAINRGGRVANIEYSIRDVYGSHSGFEVG